MTLSWVRAIRNALLPRVFGSARDGGTLGIYGVPNAGKTSLANRIAEQWLSEDVGIVSATPHETRAIQRKTGLVLESRNARLQLSIADTPGLASTVSVGELAEYCNMDRNEARKRAREATEGILKAIQYLQTIDGLLLVVDSTRDPASQTHATLLAHVRARRIPLLVAANKIDCDNAKPSFVKRAFAPYPVIAISAATGDGLPELYEAMVEVFA